ncbi:MAG: hypothetical protein LC780_06660 [Acidobacteria bacterium]|nr:hypothetical protein [Acidobacteriota bacterium]
MIDVVLKRFESPDETRRFPKGRFEIVRLGEMTIGRATYEPGWKWSERHTCLSIFWEQRSTRADVRTSEPRPDSPKPPEVTT